MAIGHDRRNGNHNSDVKIFTWLHVNIPSVVNDGRLPFLINDPRGKPSCYYSEIQSFRQTSSVVPYDPEEKSSTRLLSLLFLLGSGYGAAAILQRAAALWRQSSHLSEVKQEVDGS